jgi:hypothetical protein
MIIQKRRDKYYWKYLFIWSLKNSLKLYRQIFAK